MSKIKKSIEPFALRPFCSSVLAGSSFCEPAWSCERGARVTQRVYHRGRRARGWALPPTSESVCWCCGTAYCVAIMSCISLMGVDGEETSMRHVPTCDRDTTPDQRCRARSGTPCHDERTCDRTRIIMPNAASLLSRLRFVIGLCTPEVGAREALGTKMRRARARTQGMLVTV